MRSIEELDDEVGQHRYDKAPVQHLPAKNLVNSETNRWFAHPCWPKRLMRKLSTWAASPAAIIAEVY